MRFYKAENFDGIELWWLLPDAGDSVIPYTGTTFHDDDPANYPTANPDTNWAIVPQDVLYSTTPVPLPSAVLLLGSGLAGLALAGRRKRSDA